jgi:hypothetical protein
MKQIKLIFLVVIIILNYKNNYAQLSKGGTPHSFGLTGLKNLTTVSTPTVNADSLRLDDSLHASTQDVIRFGFTFNRNYSLSNSGMWDTLSNGDRIWRFKIGSKNALSLSFIFRDFWLPDNSEFFIYNSEKDVTLGAFTSDINNSPSNVFATDEVKGDTIILEYYEPSYASGARINLNEIIHAYKDVSNINSSLTCFHDVSCAAGNSWCFEKRAVFQLKSGGQILGTGCFVNNVRRDFTPYALVARHCMYNVPNENHTAFVNIDPNTVVVRLQFKTSTCNGTVPNATISINGAIERASDPGQDWVLLELSSKVPAWVGVFYAGWDRTANVIPPSVTCLHHGDTKPMQISVDNNQPNEIGVWQMNWDDGSITTHGASGAPLFNNNHKMIGILTDGSDNDCSDHGGQGSEFSIMWNSQSVWNKQLAHWLDPDNVGNVYTVETTSQPVYILNRTLVPQNNPNNFYSFGSYQLEGNVNTIPWSNYSICPPPYVPFTAEPYSSTIIEAQDIKIKKDTHFKLNSEVRITAKGEDCSLSFSLGDVSPLACIYANVSAKPGRSETGENSTQPEEVKQLNPLEKTIIYPNPNNGSFTIQFPQEGEKEIKVIDVYGRTIKFDNINTLETQVNLNEQKKGIYFIKVKINNIEIVKKVVIQ